MRRFWGHLLELVLIAVTLIIGWLIWFWFTAQTSQTPAKRLLGIYVITTDGQPATPLRMWLREFLLNWLIMPNVPLALIVDFLFFLADSNAQSLHDKIVDTAVVHPLARSGQRSISATSVPPLTPARPPGSDPAAGSTSAYLSQASVEERLRELQGLADQGLITVRDYEARRKRILDEL
jgi:hypothetical protein